MFFFCLELEETSLRHRRSSLVGKKIIITRTREQAAELAGRLAAQGAMAIPFPTIEIRDPDSWEPLDQALHQLSDYSWLIFTSVNGVQKFFDRLIHLRIPFPSPPPFKVASIGPATARALQAQGIEVHVLPEAYMAEGLLASLDGEINPGMKILIPRAKEAREILPEELRKTGARVDVVAAYQTVAPAGGAACFQQILSSGPVDMIIFTSSSTVKNLGKILHPSALPAALKGLSVACIGPITAATAQEAGLRVDVMPDRFDVPSLVESIERFFSSSAIPRT